MPDSTANQEPNVNSIQDQSSDVENANVSNSDAEADTQSVKNLLEVTEQHSVDQDNGTVAESEAPEPEHVIHKDEEPVESHETYEELEKQLEAEVTMEKIEEENQSTLMNDGSDQNQEPDVLVVEHNDLEVELIFK